LFYISRVYLYRDDIINCEGKTALGVLGLETDIIKKMTCEYFKRIVFWRYFLKSKPKIY